MPRLAWNYVPVQENRDLDNSSVKDGTLVSLVLQDWLPRQRPERFEIREVVPGFFRRIGAAAHLTNRFQKTIDVNTDAEESATGEWTARSPNPAGQSVYRFKDQQTRRPWSERLYVRMCEVLSSAHSKRSGRNVAIGGAISPLTATAGMRSDEGTITFWGKAYQDPDLAVELLLPWGDSETDIRPFLEASLAHYFAVDQDDARKVLEGEARRFLPERAPAGWRIQLTKPNQVLHLDAEESALIPVSVFAPGDGAAVLALILVDLGNREVFAVSNPIEVEFERRSWRVWRPRHKDAPASEAKRTVEEAVTAAG